MIFDKKDNSKWSMTPIMPIIICAMSLYYEEDELYIMFYKLALGFLLMFYVVLKSIEDNCESKKDNE